MRAKRDGYLFRDNPMFVSVMEDKQIAKHVLETVIGRKVADIEYADTEKRHDLGPSGGSIRMDVYLEDREGKAYDVEMQTYAETVVERYNNGETDYTTAYELLDRLRRLFPDSNLDTAVDRIEALNASKDAFNEAQYLEESGEAAGAISRYGEVIEDDTNYEAAQARIEAVRAAYKEQVLEEAQSLADSKDYRGAEAVLLNSSDVLGDDPDIAAKLEELQTAELDDYVEGLLKTAQGFFLVDTARIKGFFDAVQI